MKFIYLFTTFFFLSATNVYSQNAHHGSYDDFPQSGVLAASGSLPGGSLALPQLPMGMMGQAVPLLGSLSLSADKKWIFSVNNNADKPLKVSVELIQYDANRSKISGGTYTFKLKPGVNGDGKVPAASNSVGCVVFLKNWSWLN